MGTVDARPARPGEATALAGVLGRAFADDAVFAWCLRRRRRAAAIEAFFGAVLAEAIPRGGVMTEKTLRACAVWTPSGMSNDRPSLWPPGDLMWLLGLSGVLRLRRLVGLFGAMADAQPTAPHLALTFLAVDPPAQRLGLGGALLRHTLEMLDRDARAAYLETVDSRNLPYYGRHGFAPAAKFRLPHGGPEIHQMWRVPGG